MAFIPLPGGVKVAMEFTKDNQLVVNVFHVSVSAPIVSANLSAIAQLFRQWWTTQGKITSNNALALVRVVATDVSVPNGLQVVTAPATPEAGTIAAVDTPSNVALAISWRTGQTGRSYRGRTYFAGLSAQDVSTNIVGGTRLADITNRYSVLRDNIVQAGYQLVVASYYANKQPRSQAVATPINAIVVNSRVDTQRRRLPGTGA